MGSLPFPVEDLWAIGPELIITLAALVVLLWGALDGPRKRPQQFAWFTLAAVVVAAVVVPVSYTHLRAHET